MKHIIPLLITVAIALNTCNTHIVDGSTITKMEIDDRPKEKLELYFKAYSQRVKVEFFVCLYGSVEDGTLNINRIEFPPQLQTPISVSAVTGLCSPNRVGFAHSHVLPDKNPSPQDRKLIKNNPEPVHLILWSRNDSLQISLYQKH